MAPLLQLRKVLQVASHGLAYRPVAFPVHQLVVEQEPEGGGGEEEAAGGGGEGEATTGGGGGDRVAEGGGGGGLLLLPIPPVLHCTLAGQSQTLRAGLKTRPAWQDCTYVTPLAQLMYVPHVASQGLPYSPVALPTHQLAVEQGPVVLPPEDAGGGGRGEGEGCTVGLTADGGGGLCVAPPPPDLGRMVTSAQFQNSSGYLLVLEPQMPMPWRSQLVGPAAGFQSGSSAVHGSVQLLAVAYHHCSTQAVQVRPGGRR